MARPSKIRSLDDLSLELDRCRATRRIVHCHGVFDLLHIGHLRHFEQARRCGDLLVVTLTPDRYVNKGANRPGVSRGPAGGDDRRPGLRRLRRHQPLADRRRNHPPAETARLRQGERIPVGQGHHGAHPAGTGGDPAARRRDGLHRGHHLQLVGPHQPVSSGYLPGGPRVPGRTSPARQRRRRAATVSTPHGR